MPTDSLLKRLGSEDYYATIKKQSNAVFQGRVAGRVNTAEDLIHSALEYTLSKKSADAEYSDDQLTDRIVRKASYFNIDGYRKDKRLVPIKPQEDDEGNEADDEDALADMINSSGMPSERALLEDGDPAKLYEEQSDREEEERARQELTEKLLDVMTPLQREAWKYFRDGLSPEEIALLLSVSADVVYHRLGRGRIAAKKAINR